MERSTTTWIIKNVEPLTLASTGSANVGGRHTRSLRLEPPGG